MPRSLALITGASSGLGAEFARQLAAQKCDLILTARREDKLREVAKEVQDAHGITVQILTADLAELSGIEKVATHIQAEEGLDVLINNAGYGFVAPLHSSALERHLAMNNVHMTATLALSKAAIGVMGRRRDGEIINLSSVAAWLPFPGSISYSATKAYINMFSEGLQVEVKERGIHVQSLCPGFTRTGFHASKEWGGVDMSFVPEEAWMGADDVVEQSLAQVRQAGVVFIPGEANRQLVGSTLSAPYFLK